MYIYIIAIIVIIINMLNIKQSEYIPIEEMIKTLMRQAARWSTAAEQDENPMIAVLHANYGAGYLWAITEIITQDQFKRITGLDYNKFKGQITRVQDKATRKMIAVCPNFGPIPTYLTQVSGE